MRSNYSYKGYPASASSRNTPFPSYHPARPPYGHPPPPSPPTSATSRNVPYPLPQYPVQPPPYIPPPPPPPPTPPSQFSQSQFPPPGTQEATHSTQKRGPPVFERFNRGGQSATSPPRVPPKIPDPNNTSYHRRYPAPPSSVSSSSSSISSSSSSRSSRRYGSSSSPNLGQLHLDDHPRHYGGRPQDLNIRPPPRGYKPPSVESAPQSPHSLDTLSPDSKYVLDENESYFPTIPADVPATPLQEPVPEGSWPIEESLPQPSKSLRGGFTDGHLEDEPPTEEDSKSWKGYLEPFYGQSEDGSGSDSEHGRGLESSSVGSSPRESRSYPQTSPKSPPSDRDSGLFSQVSDDTERIAVRRGSKYCVHRRSTDPPPQRDYRCSPGPRAGYRPPPTQPSPSQSFSQSPQQRYQTPPPLQTSHQSPQQRYQTPPPLPVTTQTPPPRLPPPPQPRRDLLPPPPRDPLPVCPKRTPVTWGQWFHMASVPSFDVCADCYYTYVYPTLFADQFVSSEKAPNTEVSCAFSTERVLHRIWPNALDRENMNGLRDYALMRSNIPECNTVSGNPVNGLSSRWWRVADGSMPKFRCCDACYQDIVMATGFASYFAPANPQPEEEAWVCDLSFPFIAGGMLSVSNYQDKIKKDQWGEFASVVRFRQGVLPCPGPIEVKSVGREWYIPTRPIPGLAVCEACYCDNVVPHFKDKFTLAVAAPQKPLMCAMATVAVKTPWDSAVQKNTFEIWWDAVYALMTLPQCTEAGFSDQVVQGWYRLRHPHENLDTFKCCRSCYFSILRPLDLTSHFEQIRFPQQNPPAIRICSLSPDNPRFKAYMERLKEASDRRRFDIFLSYVIPRAKIPPCRGKFLAGTTWYGTNDIAVCEECYLGHVRSSSLNNRFTLGPRFGTEFESCDLYSPRMKRIWSEACAKQDINHFVQAALHRGQIYAEYQQGLMRVKDANARKGATGSLTLYTPSSASDDGHRYGRRAPAASVMDVETKQLYRELDTLRRRWKAVE